MDRRSMGRGLRWARLPVVAALSLSGLALLSGFWPSSGLPALQLKVEPAEIPADGFSTANLRLRATRGGNRPLRGVKFGLVERSAPSAG